jgi:hypothetical protein
VLVDAFGGACRPWLRRYVGVPSSVAAIVAVARRWSMSFVLASLRALHIDQLLVDGGSARTEEGWVLAAGRGSGRRIHLWRLG